MLTLVHPFATTWHFPSRGNEKFRGAFRLSADRPRMTVDSEAPRSRPRSRLRHQAPPATSHQPPATAPSGAPRSRSRPRSRLRRQALPSHQLPATSFQSSHDSPAGHSKCHSFLYSLVSYPSALSRSPGIQSGVLSMIPVISSTGVPSLHSTMTSSWTWPQMKYSLRFPMA